MRKIQEPIAQLHNVSLNYGPTQALNQLQLIFPAGCMVGLIGPDGVGKSSLLALLAGARKIQSGQVLVMGGDMADPEHRRQVCPRIAYMPQGLGRNLYPTLTVAENLDFFARLFGQGREERQQRMADLTHSTGLSPFLQRPAGKLSGGMKQKLGLCCALIHDPDLLILDEPTTGVDPLSRNQFWTLIQQIRQNRPKMSVVVASAYMDEAQAFDWLIAMHGGQVLATGTPQQLLEQTNCSNLETAFIALLPETLRQQHQVLDIPPHLTNDDIAIEATDLCKRFGDFVAVEHVSFRIQKGEIFGFLGSNGCGKSTTMKMLTGLLPASSGVARLFGQPIDAQDLQIRQRVGYMSQGFSLYAELSVLQNLELHARLFHLPASERPQRIQAMLEQFGLQGVCHQLPQALPLGLRQRLSLAVAVIHQPELLILDEPTSGVDPIARDSFWALLIRLSRQDGVTIFISTHFMNEALRCDRISLMHAGQVLACDAPRQLMAQRGLNSLEATFVAYLQEAEPEQTAPPPPKMESTIQVQPEHSQNSPPRYFSWQRLFSYSLREAMELRRDPFRAALALLGTAFLLFIMGYGINLDVEQLHFAVLDRDQTTTSQHYHQSLSGSRYFSEQASLKSYEDLEQRLQHGDIGLAVEIPPDFGRALKRGETPQVAFWIDGAMPTRADTILGYVEGIHASYLQQLAQETGQPLASQSLQIALRYRYNPDVQSLPAMAPAMLPILLMMIPAMLTALGVVREKELGSITNFYVTPVTRLEFLVGKQLPYIALGLINAVILTLLVVFFFGVPLKGSPFALLLGTLLYVGCSTGLGLLMSSVLRSQIAAIFGTAIATLLPAIQFSGLMYPVSSLEGLSAFVGNIYPTSHFLIICRGVFSKALGIQDLVAYFIPLLITIPILILISVYSLPEQER